MLLDVLVGALETIGIDVMGRLGDAPGVPGEGTQLCVTRSAVVRGRDLRERDLAADFAYALPIGALVRVGRPGPQTLDGFWVRPIDVGHVERVPPEMRASARAFGYMLDIPPGLLRTHFARSP